MKKIILLILICFQNFIFNHSVAQTYVNGGIYTNTTWDPSNSPYIITSNLVLFPGISLTIQPGVVVKFENNVQLEIREGRLFAVGTISQPIIFTSNSSNPTTGSWVNIYLNQSPSTYIEHCEFHYGGQALTGQADSLTVLNSTFTFNNLGMDAQGHIFMLVDSCTFKNNNFGHIMTPPYSLVLKNCIYINNQTGLNAQGGCSVVNCIIDSNSVNGLIKHMACDDTIRNTEIKHNGIGISHDQSGCGGTIYIHDNIISENNIGISLQNIGGVQQINLFDNCICNNTTYNLQNLTSLNINAMNNCWCSANLSYISSTVYDAYDDVSSGIVSFSPIDTLKCPILNPVGISEALDYSLTIYPNPTSSKLYLETSLEHIHSVEIINVNGKTVYKNSTLPKSIEITNLSSGVYLMKITNSETELTKKIIIFP